MSIEQSVIQFNLQQFLQDQRKKENLIELLQAIQLLQQLAEQKAKVKLKLIGSILCYFCNEQISQKEYKQGQTIKLDCLCNYNCHKNCLQEQITQNKDQFENIQSFTDILNQKFKCRNNCENKIITENMVKIVVKQKDIDKYQDDFMEIKEKKRREEELKKEEEEQKNGEFDCPICYGEYEEKIDGYKLSCGCLFCINCLKYNFKDQVKNNINIEIENITCPEGTCKKKLTFEDIATILHDDREVLEKIELKNFVTMYEKMKRENPDSLEQLIICPGKYILETGNENAIYIKQNELDDQRQGKKNIPLKENQRLVDCNYQFIQDRSIKGKVRHICERCKYQFCLNNCDSLHEGYDCSSYQKWKLDSNKDYRKELEAQGYKFCPNPTCCIVTFRDGGCNRITCTACKKSYCYLCYFLAETANEVYAHLNKVHGGYFGNA